MPGLHQQGGILFVEMVGLTLSMAALILSLFIFCHFRNLWSTQTRLRKNLFIALGIQIIVRLIIAIHQLLRMVSTTTSSSNHRSHRSHYHSHQSTATATTTGTGKSSYSNYPNVLELEESSAGTEFLRLNAAINHHKTIDDCETFLPAFLQEYMRTAMFLWLFLEALYQHSMITLFPVIQERLSLKFYYTMGWATPIGLTFIWMMEAAEKIDGLMCWSNYMFTTYFWILEGPKLAIIFMTILLLLNVIRVLVTKFWRCSSPEVNQVRKGVSRSIILVPLLGITNYLHLQMHHSPFLQNGFTVWTYLTAFITSFQGVFTALIYCILNGEVQSTLRRWHIERRNEQREICMVNGGGPVGNCPISSSLDHNATVLGRSNDSMNNNTHTGKNSSLGLTTLFFNWGNWRRRGSSQNSHSEETAGCQLKLADNDVGGHEADMDTVTIHTSSRTSRSSSIILDPYDKQQWTEADLSARCNVDIEHIEIPIEYFQKYNKKKQQQTHTQTPVAAAAAVRKESGSTCPNCDLDSRRSSAYLTELDEDDNDAMIEDEQDDEIDADLKLTSEENPIDQTC